MKRIFLVAVLLAGCVSAVSAQAADWSGVERVLKRSGAVQGEMLKVTFPRNDLVVRVGELPVEAGLALTSWIGFQGTGAHCMVMGDLVLLEPEVGPVMSRLVAQGVKVTALHNHLIGSAPVIMYLHFSAEGEPLKLAETLRSALAKTGTPTESPVPTTAFEVPIDWTRIEAIIGRAGLKKGHLFQVGFPRKEKITENGMEVPPFLGMATAINLQMVGVKASCTGDFVLLADEVNPVVKSLVEHGIAVTAVHSHMLDESPRLFFLHFWGFGEPEKLAYGLRAALDATNSVR